MQSLTDSFALDNCKHSITAADVDDLGRTARPFHFNFVQLCRAAKTKVQSLIALRGVAGAADDILPLSQLTRGDVCDRSDRILWALLRHVSNQSQLHPVSGGPGDISQYGGHLVD